MNHSFPVRIVDDKRSPVAGARVRLVTKAALGSAEHPYPSLAATHSDAGGGKYDDGKKIAMDEGDWALVATLKGKAPVVQPLKVTTGRDGSFVLTPSPGPVATVTITPVIRTVAGTKLKEITFHVTLYPAAELVFIAGLDYNHRDVTDHSWMFHDYAFDRAKVLLRENKIHRGTIVTVFSTAKIRRTKRVKGAGDSWIDVEVLHLGDPSARTLVDPPKLYEPVKGRDIDILKFYGYLAALGTQAPKSVQEIGIFSHSYPYGPILYNSGQGVPPNDYAGKPQRSPDDFDARPKDFNSANFPPYQKMLDAFAPHCVFRIWGCSATVIFKHRAAAALRSVERGDPPDTFFTARGEVYDHETPPRKVTLEEEHTSELRHRYEMDLRFHRNTYAAEAARRLKIVVLAGCPGTSADPQRIDNLQTFMVNLRTYAPEFAYYHKKFAPEFNETHDKWDAGYVDYHAMQGRTPMPRPPFSFKYYYLLVVYPVGRHTRSGAVIRFDNGVEYTHDTSDVRVVMMKHIPKGATPGIAGQGFILQDDDPDKSEGYFVQEDQRIRPMSYDKGLKEWVLP